MDSVFRQYLRLILDELVYFNVSRLRIVFVHRHSIEVRVADSVILQIRLAVKAFTTYMTVERSCSHRMCYSMTFQI